MKNAIIRSTSPLITGDARYYAYGSAAAVTKEQADKFTAKQAQKVIDSFVKAGEWKVGHHRVEVL